MLEFPTWERARCWGYPGHFGIEEGFRNIGLEPMILPAWNEFGSSDPKSWLRHAERLCKGKQFDQVWLWLVHGHYEPEFLAWIESLASIRVGWLGENLIYNDDELAQWPHLKGRKQYVLNQIRYLTHVAIAADEAEERVVEAAGVQAAWWPTAVPKRCVFDSFGKPMDRRPVFFGTKYYMRRSLINAPAVKRIWLCLNPVNQVPNFPGLLTSCNKKF